MTCKLDVEGLRSIKDFPGIHRWCRDNRVPVQHTRASHCRVRINGVSVIFAGTAGDRRAARNVASLLRRACLSPASMKVR